jgi:hypothetical protein
MFYPVFIHLKPARIAREMGIVGRAILGMGVFL